MSQRRCSCRFYYQPITPIFVALLDPGLGFHGSVIGFTLTAVTRSRFHWLDMIVAALLIRLPRAGIPGWEASSELPVRALGSPASSQDKEFWRRHIYFLISLAPGIVKTSTWPHLESGGPRDVDLDWAAASSGDPVQHRKGVWMFGVSVAVSAILV